jgi:hypothetical protein
MIFDELQDVYGPYAAERVRQGLTLETFEKMPLHELQPYFEGLAERCYDEYIRRLNVEPPKDSPAKSKEQYLDVLYRRWQDAQEIVEILGKTEKKINTERVG